MMRLSIIDIEPIDVVPIALDHLDREPIGKEPIEAGPIDIEPIDAVLIALDPLDREPTLLSRSTQSLACSKPIFNNYCAIMNMLLTGSDNLEPIYHRYRAYRCSAHRTRPSRSRAYIIKSLHPECCLLKTNFQQLLCNNEYAINWE